MSRFATITVAFAATMAGVALWTDGTTRWWALASTAGVYAAIVGAGVACIRLRLFVDAICRGKPGGMRIALTFDDGPDPAATPALLGVLQEQGVKAAFFCVGQKVLSAPDLARRIASEGHLLANHSYRHAWWTNFLTGRALSNEIALAQNAIEETTGHNPSYYRPPVGLTNPGLSAALNEAGLACIGWDVRGLDRNPRRWETVVRRVTRKAADGSIVVLHDGGADPARLVAVVSAIIARLRSRGYNLARLDELLGAPDEPNRS